MEKTIEKYMRMWKQNFEEQERYIQEVRSIMHDLQAHLIVLQYYIEDEKYEEAKVYLRNMRNHGILQHRECEIEVGNTLVNVLLMEYLKKSKEDILFSSKGMLPEGTIITDYDWCTIFSNLISNAIEACEKLYCTQKKICLEISTDEKNFYVFMKNPVEWNVEKELLENGTTKEDKNVHGFGLKNVKSIVESYHGAVEYVCEKDTFVVKISLPIR